MKLTENARVVLEKRYLIKNDLGKVLETPEQLFQRVAKAIAEPEKKQKRTFWEDRFVKMMTERRFIPNSPTLMNGGKPRGQLSACFVLPIDDSLDSIFDTLKYAAKIHQSGGGTGFSFSRLRPQGSIVRTSQGVASGPVSFMRIFDAATETIKQGGTRRGANMAILRVDHPDILEFIDSKRDQRSIQNFNISVGVTDEFMVALQGDGMFSLKDPRNGVSVRQLKARDVFRRMTESAWECGDPGVVFLDRINLFNPTPQVGPMESTNPCGEQPLLPFESCNLGSLNLGEYIQGGKFNWELFEQDIIDSVRFLDNVIDVNCYPIVQCEKITLRNRKIGLGVMGLADLLLMEGLPYTSPEAERRGEQVMSFLDRVAKKASARLAQERSPFPNWKGSLWQRLGYPEMRNATVTTVAPTGTISMIAGASSGIEPLFAGVYHRNVLDGQRLSEVHPAVERLLRDRKISVDQLTDDQIGKYIGPAWTPTHLVPVEVHVRMQAAFQRHSDSAVSKTINLPVTATVEDIAKAYQLAYQLGCKGITVYRDQSKPTQVLERPPQQAPDAVYCPSC